MRRRDRNRRHPWWAPTSILALVALVILLGAGTALAADRWTDIGDQQWIDRYHVTASEVATVAAGYEDGSFRPELAVNRGQFAKMVVAGLGLGTWKPPSPTFTDVPATNPYFPWIEGARSAQIISGFDDDTFRPETPISRQQADSILGLFLSQEELAITGHIRGELTTYPTLSAWCAAEGADLLDPFADADLLASVHAPYMAYLVYHNVVEGSSRLGGVYLDPRSALTRAQAVALVLRAGGVSFDTDTTGLHLQVTGIPSPGVAGTASSVTVAVVDEADTVVAGYAGTVRFTSTDPYPAALPADYTFTAADAGTHTFAGGVTLKTAGSQTVTATDTVTASIAGSQTGTVKPAAATKLAFGVQPTNTVAGAAITPAITVRIEDAYGNLVATDNGTTVTLAIGANPGFGTLGGTATRMTSGGVALFGGLSIDKVGSGYTLEATNSPVLASATSTTFSITPATTTTLFPSALVDALGALHTVTVTVRDQFGEPMPNVAVYFFGTPTEGGGVYGTTLKGVPQAFPSNPVLTNAHGIASAAGAATAWSNWNIWAQANPDGGTGSPADSPGDPGVVKSNVVTEYWAMDVGILDMDNDPGRHLAIPSALGSGLNGRTFNVYRGSAGGTPIGTGIYDNTNGNTVRLTQEIPDPTIVFINFVGDPLGNNLPNWVFGSAKD